MDALNDSLDDIGPDAELIACPQCDALWHVALPGDGQRAVCHRCHTVLIAPRRNASLRIVALAVTVLILVAGAAFFPFLEIRVTGFSNRASLLDAALAFSGGPMLALSIAVAALIVLVPVARVILLLYVLVPLAFGRAPPRRARSAFALSEALKPWSMAEIFVLGVAVALVKVADLAHIGFGPAFWMFAALVIILLLQDRYMCRWSVWKALE